VPLPSSNDVVTNILRNGARQLLMQAINAEVRDWIDKHANQLDARGRRQVVRNGYLPKRSILTGLEPELTIADGAGPFKLQTGFASFRISNRVLSIDHFLDCNCRHDC
jgi:hypothetical protein